MNYPIIEDYGFSDRFAALASAYENYAVGRVLSQEKGIYRVISEQGEQLAEVSGKLRYQAVTASDYPAVGDFVMLDTGVNGGRAIIHHVLPRKSVFIRKAAGTGHEEQVVAANIDTVFICMSLNNDFNVRRLERYLSIGWDSGATPVVVLTKADLCENLPGKLNDVEAIALGSDILVTSAVETDGYAKIRPYLRAGRTVALIGSSGVGKSTLINRLLGEDKLDTNGLRNDDKGRHTTTHRELLLLPDGGMVIDTPGMRELGMWDVSEGLDKSFSDVEALVNQCRFHDCGHTNEPGCAVRAALESGELSPERWQSYLKIRQEASFADSKTNYMAQKKKKMRDISIINKSNRKK